MKRPGPIAQTALALVAAAAIWLPALHLCFRARVADYRADAGLAPCARELANAHLSLWADSAARAAEIARMRRSNAEWDFMGRTFVVLALANMSLREPAQQGRYLEVMDTIIDETVRQEKAHGVYYFLMDYAREGDFLGPTHRSLFEDGEIAWMMAARRCVEEKPAYLAPFAERVALMRRQMEAGPVLCGESYPDECWMFCNAVALAVFRMSDALDGTDHANFIARWLATARARLVDPKTGLLISKFSLAGEAGDGPEGSSIWMVAHCLQLVDRDFAADQYRRARRELARNALGFGYAREWPASWIGPADIDSGPVLPVLGVSAGSSGMAILGAAAFDDRAYLGSLLTTLNFGGFPARAGGRLRYRASNQVGDAVLLYASTLGPLWAEVETKAAARGQGVRP